jgi:sortase A
MAGGVRVPYTSATLKGLRVYGGLFAVAMLVALVTLAVLPTTQAARTEPRPAETVPAAEKASKPSRADKAARESAYDKLSLNKLAIERPAPKKPAPAPKPEQNEKKAERAPQTANVSMLPGQPRKAPARRAPKKEPPKQEPPKQEPPKKQASSWKAPEGPPARAAVPHNARLLLSIPRLGMKDVTIGDSSEQAYLDREGIMHFSGTGFPYRRGSNTYIVGHAGDYDTSRVPNPFRNLKELRPGDLIALRDATGKTYNYRIYDRFVVSPRDVWVMDPVAGKSVVTFQTCFPAPVFDKRLIVRGELVR